VSRRAGPSVFEPTGHTAPVPRLVHDNAQVKPRHIMQQLLHNLTARRRRPLLRCRCRVPHGHPVPASCLEVGVGSGGAEFIGSR
jgi:hypothetical protein